MKLNNHEITKLKAYKKNIEAKVIRYIIGIFISSLFAAFMPFSFFANKAITGKGDTMLESIGVYIFSGFVISIILFFVFLIMYYLKYIPVIQDLYKKEKTTIKVKVLHTEELSGVEFHELELTFHPEYKNKNKVSFVDFPDFPLLVKNQHVEIELTPKSLFPVCIKAYGKIYRI